MDKPIYCGSCNIQDFVTEEKKLNDKDKETIEKILGTTECRDIFSPEKKLVKKYKKALVDHYYMELDLGVFGVSQKFTDPITVPKFIIIPHDRNYFHIEIVYSSLILDDPVKIKSVAPQKVQDSMAKCFPILGEYNATHIDDKHEKRKEIRNKIRDILQPFNLDYTSFPLKYNAEFILPEVAFERIKKSHKILPESRYYFMIEAKTEFWNSEKYDVPKNIMIIAIANSAQEDNGCRIIDVFDPLNLTGETNG